jgi:protein STE50
VEIFKSLRLGLDDPCYKILPHALKKYNIQDDWRNYAMYIGYGDQERPVGLDEKPLALFRDLERKGKRPMFMLRKLAQCPGVAFGIPGGVL